MPPSPLTIWTNYTFPPAADALLRAHLGPHQLVTSSSMQASNLTAGAIDPSIAHADVVLGQPSPDALLAAPRVKWVHLTSAGYDRYDRPDLRAAFKTRGAALTTSSGVYEEPCAEHAFAMMLSLARQLPQCQDAQRTDRSWRSADHRLRSDLLLGQTAVILSYGAIARRLVELLAPFRMKLYAVRRTVTGDEPIETVTETDVAKVLPDADHLISILPGGESTRHYIDAAKIARMKRGSIFYNIGRGTTVDQNALLAALESGQIQYAYLDVTDPEPLPPAHPLWAHPNCLITPHTAGGHADEFERLAQQAYSPPSRSH